MTVLLTADFLPSHTLLHVDDPTAFALDQVLQLRDELVIVRGRTRAGAPVLVGRGAYGTTRSGHDAGDPVALASLVVRGGQDVEVEVDSFAVFDEDGAGFEVRPNGVVQVNDASSGSPIIVEPSGRLDLGTGSTVAVTTEGWLWIESLGQDPDDSALAIGAAMIVYFDRTVGNAKLKVKARDRDGNYYTGELALTPVVP